MPTEDRTKQSEARPVTIIDCPGTPAEVLERLDSAARRGKLPGFAKAQKPGSMFTIADFGAPFESVLEARGEAAGSGTRLEVLPPRLKPLFPWAFALILALTIWPGGWLTDSMMRSYWDWYSAGPWWITYIWYMPLTVPFCPLAMRSALRKSRAAAAAEMPELIKKIVDATGGREAASRS